jgi:2-methylcitrate dehydratase PrpD
MSIPYAVACALRYGKVNYQQYEEDCLEDQELLALTRKVSVREDEAFSKLVPGKRVALVRVRTGEETYQDQVEYPLGEPENPMTQDMLEEKYHSLLSAAGISEDRRNEILAAVYDIEHRFDDFLESL